MFERASQAQQESAKFPIILRDLLRMSDCTITTPTDFLSGAMIFSFLKFSADESIPVIRILNTDLGDCDQSEDLSFEVWQETACFSIGFLLDLSQTGSHPKYIPVVSNNVNHKPALRSFPTDLSSCNSIMEMIPLIFKMYSIECSLYKNVNHFMRCFPIGVITKFMKELNGILGYIYLLQSSIHYYSRIEPLLTNTTVYRGIDQRGQLLVPLYESMVGEVIVWPSFTSTSTNRTFVIEKFIRGEDSLLFEISLHPGDDAAAIHNFSFYRGESEILIAASSGFMVEEVSSIDIRGMKIAQVRLTYCMSWYDFNIDDPPVPIVI
jgi:hypothetical protein